MLTPGPLEGTLLIAAAVVVLLFFGLLVLCLMRMAKYFKAAEKDQERMGRELGRVADELEHIHEEWKTKRD